MDPRSPSWQSLNQRSLAVGISAPSPCPSRTVKRGLDVVAAGLGLLVLAVPLVGLMALVRLVDGGPALFRQVRVGRGGRRFTLYKLRTMVPSAEARLAQLWSLNEADAPLFKMRRDPRVTWLGGWLRRTSLDELPQLINVLRGEMSLVGPRPMLPEEVAALPERFRRRLHVLPGMTGLWQVSGRAALPLERGLELDLHYVDRWGLALDLWVLMRTAPAVLSGVGAC